MGPYVLVNLIGISDPEYPMQCIQSLLVSRVIVLLSLSNIQHDWVTVPAGWFFIEHQRTMAIVTDCIHCIL